MNFLLNLKQAVFKYYSSFYAPSLETIIYFLIGLDCWQQLNRSPASDLSYLSGFLLCVFSLFRKATFKLSWEVLVGKSTLDLRKSSHIQIIFVSMLITLTARFVLENAVPIDFKSAFPYSANDFANRLTRLIIEETVFTGIVMNVLCRSLPASYVKPILVFILIWTSYLSRLHYLSLSWIILGLIVGWSYKRFTSVSYCVALHILWNLKI